MTDKLAVPKASEWNGLGIVMSFNDADDYPIIPS